jgi:hypothetical protein
MFSSAFNRRDGQSAARFHLFPPPVVDSLSLPTPTLTFAKNSSRKDSTQMHQEEKEFYGKSYGAGGSGNFTFNPPAGVGLGGSIPLSGLSLDNKLQELMKTLGMQGLVSTIKAVPTPP